MRSTRLKKRRGVILIAVLVCLGIATTIVLGAVQTSIRQHRQVRKELQVEQTKWLLDAGIDRAVESFLAQPETYQGETLTITPPPKKYANATIEISLLKFDRQSNRAAFRVAARIAGTGSLAPTTKRSREFVLDASVDRDDEK